jgi:hypothetical protein
MDISADLDRSFEFEQDGLGDENLSSLCAKVLDFVFLKLDGFSRSVTTDCGTKRTQRMSVCDIFLQNR